MFCNYQAVGWFAGWLVGWKPTIKLTNQQSFSESFSSYDVLLSFKPCAPLARFVYCFRRIVQIYLILSLIVNKVNITMIPLNIRILYSVDD
jgi:hypothetical protein